MKALKSCQLHFIHPTGSLSELAPSGATMAKLVPLFTKFGLLPSVSDVFELRPEGPRKTAAMQLLSSDAQWRVDFEPDRVRIEFLAAAPGEKSSKDASQSVTDLIDSVKNTGIGTLEEIMDLCPVLATRLAVLFNGLNRKEGAGAGDEFSPPESRLKYYVDNGTVEWSSRRVARLDALLGDKQEKVNVVTELASPEIGPPPFRDAYSRIYSVDVNTWQGHTRPRFDVGSVRHFVDYAEKQFYEIQGQIDEL